MKKKEKEITIENQKILDEIKAHIKKMKKAGRCVQCQYPWYDGLCECGKDDGKDLELENIARKAYALEDLGIELP